MELEIFKTYIKIHLKTKFIQLSKFPLLGISILFNKKPDGSFCLFLNYYNPNNLVIKN